MIGSPSGNAEAGVLACSAPPTTTSCPDEQLTFTGADGSYELALTPRHWWAEGVVVTLGLTGETIQTGPVQKVTIKAGIVTTANFTVNRARHPVPTTSRRPRRAVSGRSHDRMTAQIPT